MNEEFRQQVIETLRRGEELPADWARLLFPPERREYELTYYGKEREEDIIADTMAVPLQPASTFGKNGSGWHNNLIFGDNLQVMKTLLKMKEEGQLTNADGTPGVRLIYIDPPFATKREFAGTQEQKAYQDKIVGAEFLEFLRKRLILLRELLSNDGSIYVHVDWKRSHYVRVLLDEIFGEPKFINEVIWYYTNKYGANSGAFDSFHNTIFRYGVSKRFVYEPIRIPVKTARTQPTRKWNKELNKNEWVRDETGNYLYQDSVEKDAGDVWEIPVINPMAKERKDIDYPTQKPERLLEWVIRSSSREGDIVLDAFAGSGTAAAVAEKLGRRWVAIDCGKLSIYTIQKRMFTLKNGIGNNGPALKPKPFTVFNAGLYDFSTLKTLPWEDWRFFALQLFNCKDEPHRIGGMALDGKLKGASVLVFNHRAFPGKRIDEDTINDIHVSIGKKVGPRFFIIAPRGVFDFQQDYITLDGVRYYAMRIPYSVISELHHRDFKALQQPSDETAVNDTVDAVGFDFIQPPTVEWEASINKREGGLFEEGCISIKKFESRARIRGADTRGGLETFSMLMLDFDYKGEVFNYDALFFADGLKENGWEARFSAGAIGEKTMAVFIDIYGNESWELIPQDKFQRAEQTQTVEAPDLLTKPAAPPKPARKQQTRSVKTTSLPKTRRKPRK